MPKKIDLTGKRFGRLVILREAKKCRTNDRLKWVCLCDCGKELKILASSLRSGNTKSCGCLQKENTSKATKKHGCHASKTYKSWTMMKQRCYNKKYSHYHLYGGRGITVCDRWLNSFDNFLKDMGFRIGGKSLDRIDNNGNYVPENCKWSNQSEQVRNQNRNINAKGFCFCNKTNKWISQIYYNGKNHHLGLYKTKEQAYQAYINKKKEVYD